LVRGIPHQYSAVIANAEKCSSLVQLDPLSAEDREAYLCLSLKVTKVRLPLL
jgi:hypothetical protein